MSEPTPTPGQPSKDDLKAALKAFRKRLKLTRLEEESKIGRRPTTSGRDCGIVGINAPIQFPIEVWDELVKQGKLKRSSRGVYELVEE